MPFMSKICKKDRGNNLLHLSVRWNEYRKYSDFWGPKRTKKSKMLDGTVWCVKRFALKRQFQKYVTFINRIIRSIIISKKPKLKKNGVLFFDLYSLTFLIIPVQKLNYWFRKLNTNLKIKTYFKGKLFESGWNKPNCIN